MGWAGKSVLVFLGAGVGGVLRFWLGSWIQSSTGSVFPWGTFVVNVSGCLAIGLIVGWIGALGGSATWRLLLVVGLLGGYTTFSSFGFETLTLIRDRNFGVASLYAIGSVAVGLAAVWAGDAIGRRPF